MITGRLPMPARLVLLLLGLCTAACHAKDNHDCEPSSCGDIRNISYPFRLNDDPKKCGKSRYNLSCENNVTVLQLYSGKYYVLAINYGNYKVRVVDANFRKDNCSSLPPYSLASDNFSISEDPYDISQYREYQNRTREWFELSKPIIFMTCETRPVNSSLYVDTAPCINARSGHSFAITGRLNASDLGDSCRIELMVLTSSSIGIKDVNRSYIDIHNELLYGFDLSWSHYGRSGDFWKCYIQKVNCDNLDIVDYMLGATAIIFTYILQPVGLWTGTKAVLGIPCVIVV